MRPAVVVVLALGLVLARALGAAPAFAGHHTVQRGETLEHVAKIYGCTTESVLRANHLTNTLVRPGTIVEVPTCNVTTHARTRAKVVKAEDDLDERAEKALAVIDGAAVVKVPRPPIDEPDPEAPIEASIESVGEPWHGKLRNGEPLPDGAGYQIRRPQRSFGASHVVTHLQHAIAEVRALYPDVHTLAIGDLSQRGGGKIADHHSHQSGLDVDVGFYFTKVPHGYPDAFVGANGDLDLEATWALVTAFARTASLPTGVQMIFLDRDVQARLYKFARGRGTPDEDLEAILQYPRGKDELVGLVRHWPNHADHLHVRFKPGR